MPKRSKEDMEVRRQRILRAARACFARKGFHATTISDICREAKVSAGGIYTHFENKHAIAAAIGGQATEPGLDPIDLLMLLDSLRTDDGEENCRLDLNLWAESLRDDALAEMVAEAMNSFRATLKRSLPKSRTTTGWLRTFEALALGLEVQRALGRRQGAPLRDVLAQLIEDAE